GQRVPAVPRRVLPAVGEGVLPAEQTREGRAGHGRTPRETLEHHVPGAGRGRQGGQHRAARLRQAARRAGGRPGQGVRRAAGRAHLADRRPRRRGALLAESCILARGPLVGRGEPRSPGGQTMAMAQAGSQELLDLWTKQMEEGSETWLRMLRQGLLTDPQAFWRAFMDQGAAAWSALLTQASPSPDLSGQWKPFLDQ